MRCKRGQKQRTCGGGIENEDNIIIKMCKPIFYWLLFIKKMTEKKIKCNLHLSL
jgi:hypothetical protein